MSANYRVACLAISLLLGTLGISVRAKVSISHRHEASFAQPPGLVADKAARLTKTDIYVRNGELHLAITTEGEPSLSLFHVYLDTDLDASTGYQPPSRKPDEIGANYLIEGASLHVWEGADNHAAWSWKAMDAAKISRGPQGEIQVSVPLEKLNIKTPNKLRVLVETLTEKWESADTLPRQGIWQVDLTGSSSADSNPPASAAAPVKSETDSAGANSVRQNGKAGARKSASLVNGSASVGADFLAVKVTTEAEPDAAMYHIYIDTDMNASTGFHPATAVAGLGGADFLCEGATLHAWDGGNDQSVWRWRGILSVRATRTGANELQISIPLAPLNLQGKQSIQLLFETINTKWEGEDVIPREGVWRISLPQKP